MVASMLIVGTATSYEDQIVSLSFITESVSKIDTAFDFIWLFDTLARFGGGLLAYFLIYWVNPYIFVVVYSVVGLAGHITTYIAYAYDIDGGLLLVVPACLVGTSVGGLWVIVPQILLDEAGIKPFPMLWGLTILANCIGIILFGIYSGIYYSE